ncbi:MAG: hypothetical protein JNM40_18915 [Myxococcales bacterium]|nr:hypothetical protein [Myxococcales bacterium]
MSAQPLSHATLVALTVSLCPLAAFAQNLSAQQSSVPSPSSSSQPLNLPPAPGLALPPNLPPPIPTAIDLAPTVTPVQAPVPIPIPSPMPNQSPQIPSQTAAVPLAPPPPSPPATPPFVELTSLRLLRDKGVISQAEYDSAMHDLQSSLGSRAADSTTLVIGKWATTLFGFAQADVMYFSTQSFNDYAGNLQVARPDTFAGQHGRTEFTARDSRIGFRIEAPELSWLRASALLEMDFLGPTGAIGSSITEASFFNNPNLRVRHAYFKMETPVVDILFGHTWHLFGFQPSFVPADVQWSGVVGSLFSRTMQLRISKTVKTKPVTLEFAVSANRPPQRDSMVPEFEAGARLAFNNWKGVHTLYVTATTTMAAQIAVSADLRRFTLPQFSASPQDTNSKTGLGIAVDAFLPIIPGTKDKRSNSLSLVGEFVSGQGINDLYVGLVGGVNNPPLPTQSGMTAPAFVPGDDPGLAVYDKNGELRLPHWMTFIVGLEYYPPRIGNHLGLFANFAKTQLLDCDLYVNPAKVRDTETLYNAGLFVDITQAIRVGADWAYFDDLYADGVHATTHAVQGVGFFFF